MASFLSAFEKVIELEGGYTLHEVPGDKGGMTYAGIARNAWPDWKGWEKLDKGVVDKELYSLVRFFYKKNFWDTMNGDCIKNDSIAFLMFSFGVNTGRTIAVRLAQQVLGVATDGVFGPISVTALNAQILDKKDEELFKLRYALLKIQRYKNIAYLDKRRKDDKVGSDLKFLIGWINRVEKELSFSV